MLLFQRIPGRRYGGKRTKERKKGEQEIEHRMTRRNNRKKGKGDCAKIDMRFPNEEKRNGRARLETVLTEFVCKERDDMIRDEDVFVSRFPDHFSRSITED